LTNFRQINKYITKTVALISTVFFALTVAHSQQTPKELGQTIFLILKAKNITSLDSVFLTVDEWTALVKSNKMTDKEINQFKDTLTNDRKELKDRFAEMLDDGEVAGIVWAEIILDSVEVSEFKFYVGESDKVATQTNLFICFSYEKRKFYIGIRVFQYKNKWKIGAGAKPNEILFNELITIPKKIGY
jgi:hypothetical protein